MARLSKLLALAGLVAGAATALKRRRQDAGAGPYAGPGAAAATPSASSTPPVTAATPPPAEAPGPSVPTRSVPVTETERAEAADATAPDPEVLARQAGGPVDALVEEQVSAAAAEARGIGGRPGDDDVTPDDPAMAPVYEAGGGEQEGFELSERELIDAASHGDGGNDPMQDRFTPEVESDRSTARYGEPDEEDVTEVVRDVDPATGEPEQPDDPGEGPGIAADR